MRRPVKLLLPPSLVLLQVNRLIVVSIFTVINGLFCCCVGLVYTYLAGHVGRTGDQGAFRALARGYTHWSSGRLEEMDVNTNHPEYCHVRCTMTPSMKSIPYHIYLLLGRDGELATICSATCECAAGYVVFCCYTCVPSLPLPLPPIYLLIRHTASTYA